MTKIERSVAVFFIATCALTSVSGCWHYLGRKRSIPTAPELDEEIAIFMGKCAPLILANHGTFKSLQSVVDYVIRDTNWYKDTYSKVCAGERNVAECWIYALDFLLDPASRFFKPTAECICAGSKECWTPPRPPPPLRRQKRSVSTRNGENGFDSACVLRDVQRYRRKYPSLSRFEPTSVKVFLKDHYTYCRRIPDFPYEQRNLFQLLYIDQVCPKTGIQAMWRRNSSEVFKEATRSDGPLAKVSRDCDAKNRDPCDPNPCLNRGRCVAVATERYRCICPTGYAGYRCEKRIPSRDRFHWCTKWICRTGFSCFCPRTCVAALSSCDSIVM